MLRTLIVCATLLRAFHVLAAQALLPSTHAQTLDGTSLTFPSALNGNPAVIILGFTQGARTDVTHWSSRLTNDPALPPTRIYSAAMFAAVPRLLRGVILRKLTSSVPERARPHFLILTDHEPEWKSIAAYQKPDEAYLLLLDPTGHIRYTTHGPLTDIAYTDLTRRALLLTHSD